MAMLQHQRGSTHHRPCQHQASRGHALLHRRVRTRSVTATAEPVSLEQTVQLVNVDIEKTSWTSRKLFASISVQAPAQVVWGCLTNYEGLGEFIPSLVENVCLERKSNGAVLKQVGAQDVAMGVKFSAACVLDCTEYPQGVPQELCSFDSDSKDDLLPYPRNSQQNVPSMDISFKLVDGDFQAFQGIWRMQPHVPAGSTDSLDDTQCSVLCYALYVQPKAWLPVGLIQSRIQAEVTRNLAAVRAQAELIHQQRQQAQEPA